MVHGAFGLADGDRGVGGDGGGGGEGFVEEGGRVAEAVDHAPAFGVGGGPGAAAEEEFLGAALADGAGEELGAAGTGHDAEGDFGEGEAGGGGGVDEVAGERDLAAAAIGGAVDGGDDRDRAGDQGGGHALEDVVLGLPLGVGHSAALLEVAAGAEGAVAGAGEDDGAAGVGVGGEGAEDVEQVEAHLGVEGVHGGGAVEGDLEEVRLGPGH